MTSKVTINHGRVVPAPFRFVIILIAFGGMVLAMQNLSEFLAISSCIVLSMLFPLSWSSYHILQVIPEEKAIKEGYWVMGIKRMNRYSYTSLEKIFVTSGSNSQTIHAQSGISTTTKSREFRAYLKTDEGEKYEILSVKSEQNLMKKLEPISRKLKIPVEKIY